MRIITISIEKNNDQIEIHLETVKSKLLTKTTDDYSLDWYKYNKAEMLESYGLKVRASEFLFTSNKKNENNNQNSYSCKYVTIILPDDVVKAVHLVEKLERMFKIRDCDYIFLGTDFVKNLLLTRKRSNYFIERLAVDAPVHCLTIDMDAFVANKPRFPKQNKFTEYLIDELLRLNPQLKELNVLKLLDPAINQDVKENILKQIVSSEKSGQAGFLQRLMAHVSDYAKKALISPCYGKTAHDHKNYTDRHTELALLREAEFSLRDDGRMSINLANNTVYDKWYAKQKSNHGLLKPELMYLGKIIGLEFADDSDFEKEIIFTPDCTKVLMQKGLHYTGALMEELKRQEENKACADNHYRLRP